MKQWFILIALLAMLGWALFDFWFDQEEELAADVGLDIGNLAPDFTLETMDGERVHLSDYRGKPVLLNFWATWCLPCREEMPDMEQLYQDTDVQVLAVNLTSTENSIRDVEHFVAEYGLTFPILLDQHSGVSDLYQIRPLPTTYIIDAEGVIQLYVFGPLTYDQMQTEYGKIMGR
ncbi:redoxin domain-containing protein [Gracilibacillus alcaliphilus]|uniref:redoxin domain-containing protein n=1 Tax=Gracilibacillus alcaliphilus TaxID=1401441 RepID=UPI00195AE48A|nr:redoxin domain-containing protein [Gracilibacillus alcaliphilus]MBM7679778.1 peroxiredoxin [Gracilibacillus alcaliphilus]